MKWKMKFNGNDTVPNSPVFEMTITGEIAKFHSGWRTSRKQVDNRVRHCVRCPDRRASSPFSASMSFNNKVLKLYNLTVCFS